MAQFMKKASLGRMVIAEGGASDPELAEVRLTPEEYSALWKKIRTAERDVSEARADAEKRESEAYRDAQRQLKKYKDDAKVDADRRVEYADQARYRAEERASVAEAEKRDLEAALSQQRSLNDNLKRIAKERANAKRGLTPKKERSGYIVLFSSQYRERYRNDEGVKCVANTWKSVLQTPYDATLPLEQIKDDVWDELMHQVLYPMGFRKVQDTDKNGEYKRWVVRDEKDVEKEVEVCGLYRWNFKANYRSGFWEMDLYHTMSLYVPEEYRPVVK